MILSVVALAASAPQYGRPGGYAQHGGSRPGGGGGGNFGGGGGNFGGGV